MVDLENVLKEEFPELSVNFPIIPGTSNITTEELSKAVQYIKKNELVQDSAKLLTSSEKMRNSISYNIIFPNQERDLTFVVDWIQGPMVYLGKIQSSNKVGNNIIQARFYDMYLK